MSIVYWDVETYSQRNLKECGAHVYAADPSTGVFFMGYAIDDGEVQTWWPGDPVPAPFADPTGHLFVSDNWTFENLILTHVLIPQHGFTSIPIEQQDCAQRRALANAFPAELGLRCKACPTRKTRRRAERCSACRACISTKIRPPANATSNCYSSAVKPTSRARAPATPTGACDRNCGKNGTTSYSMR